MKEVSKDIPQIKPQSVLDPIPHIGEEAHTEAVTPPHTHTNVNESMAHKVVKKPRKRAKKLAFGLMALLLILGIVGGLLFVFVGIPAKKLYDQGQGLADRARAVKASLGTQDISVVKAELQRFKTDLVSFRTSYESITWMKKIPRVGLFVADGEAALEAGVAGIEAGEVMLQTIEPYADIIGFKGADSRLSKSGEDNANNRLEFLVKTIKEITPQMGVISEKASFAESKLRTIDPNRYPEEFRGIKVREELTKLLTLAEDATEMIAQSKPMVEQAPYFLGVDEPRKYLLIFQNDSELRPTGGFLSAYSIVEVNKGKFRPVSSSDIYILDGKYTPQIPAPEIFRTYLQGIYIANNKLRLRDMNWSPDFRTSMELFVPEAKKAGLTGFDGIIVADTKVLQNVLSVIGTIGVPGFGNFGVQTDPRCNCPQFIYELQSYTSQEGAVVWSQDEPGKIIFAPRNYGKNRKDVLGEVMNSVLANALGQPKEKIPQLAEAGLKSIWGKHLQMYMLDPEAQAALESFNLAGRMRDFEGDYLHINNANLGGRKSNLYVEYEVNQTYKKGSDGTIEKTVEITYKNPQKFDGWLNSVLPNWTRIYVPKGSTLVTSEGFETPGDTEEEFGRTVFSGGFKLRPEGVKTVSITYKLPMKSNGTLPLLIQKQGGIGGFLYTTVSGRQSVETPLTQDTELLIRI